MNACWWTSERITQKDGYVTQVRVADYIARRIRDAGVETVFLITGGGAMHLDDAIGRCEGLEYVCNHHEQACALAAEGYARATGGLGVAVVTSGPGGTNTITGVLGQWHDSVPVLYVSGQVRRDTTVASTGLPLRQLGDQEADIVAIVSPITKYAVMLMEPDRVRYELEKCLHLACSGRPGPVWLDVPVDVQGSLVDEEHLEPYRGDDDGFFDEVLARGQAAELAALLSAAERPVLLAGSGVRIGHAIPRFLKVAERLGAPLLTAWNAVDVLWEDHPLFVGRPGSIGDRAGNFALQNADVVVSLGCRLNVRQIGYEFKAFARAAYLAVVDIDPVELRKPTIAPDLPVHADVGFLLDELDVALSVRQLQSRAEWLEWCLERKRRYPVVLPEYRRAEVPVNPYVFVDALSGHLDEDSIVVTANGAAVVISNQALRVPRGARLICSSGTASMGYDLPAAIGACVAAGRPVICLAGDGSVQMNLQELQTIVHHRLPVKLFIFDNQGYLSMRQTQDNLFGGRYVGADPGSGVSLPDMTAIAGAYGIPARTVRCHGDLDEAIGATLAGDGPQLCVVVMDPRQPFSPKVAGRKLPDGRMVSNPLEDMHPLLEREELADNMLVPLYCGREEAGP
jgi:acetolactate synthase-1/2/3 large subunit